MTKEPISRRRFLGGMAATAAAAAACGTASLSQSPVFVIDRHLTEPGFTGDVPAHYRLFIVGLNDQLVDDLFALDDLVSRRVVSRFELPPGFVRRCTSRSGS